MSITENENPEPKVYPKWLAVVILGGLILIGALIAIPIAVSQHASDVQDHEDVYRLCMHDLENDQGVSPDDPLAQAACNQ